jgi:hypothetical protein
MPKTIYQILNLAFLICRLNLPIQSIAQIDRYLENGDLLFQDLDCGPMCDAIESVTEGVDGQDFSHVGMVYLINNEWMVAEAISKGVVWTPLDTFCYRSKRNDSLNIVQMRIDSLSSHEQAQLLKFINQHLDVAYDYAFIYNNGNYYCSELLYDAFESIERGDFQLEPMTFKAKGDSFFPIWIDYYNQLGQAIPEGKAGINPGSMSRSPALKIVRKY